MSDLPALAASLDRALARRGVAGGTARAATFVAAATALPPQTPLEWYWLARISLLRSGDDLERFHAALADLAVDLPEFGAAPAARPVPRLAGAPSPQSATDDDTEHAPREHVSASPDERLADTDLAELDDDGRRRALALIERLRIAAPLRRTRRRVRARNGDRIDVRATLRAARRTDAETIRLVRSQRRRRVRPLVIACDVSGSMAPYARAFLYYARVCAAARPRVSAYAFATQLTDLSALLRRTTLTTFLPAAGAAARDYGGGTRIAASLDALANRLRRGAARGATLVVLSDGWERDDPAGVGRALARLRRLTRRIVWANPRASHPAYAPLAAGMAAAVPYLDRLMTGHSVRSLERIAEALGGER